jgi:hypothetical protein
MHELKLRTTWTIYDNMLREFYGLTSEELKSLINNKKVKLTGQYKKMCNGERLWVDAEINVPKT